MLDPYPTFTPLASFSNVASIFRMAAPDADQVESLTKLKNDEFEWLVSVVEQSF